MKDKIKPAVTSGLSMLLALSCIQSTQAQDDEIGLNKEDLASVLEEIIVTARIRQETLQDSPVAISAFSADSLKEAGINNTRDLQRNVPGLSFTEQGTKAPAIFIRGVGQRESSSALDPGVGVYVNGIYIPRTDAQLLDTVGTQSIQVLRGPQGTLFGKNNTGGAILVTTEAPHTDQFEGYTQTRIGNFGRQDAKFSVNIPLNEESLALRFGLNSVKLDGYLRNIADGKKYGDEERLAATARLNWQASDTLNVDLFTYWSKQSERGAGFTCLFSNERGDIATLHQPGLPEGIYEQRCRVSESLADDNKIAQDVRSTFNTQNSISALTLNWEFDDIEVKSITAFSVQNDIVIEDDQDSSDVVIIGNGTRTYEQVLGQAGVKVEDEERQQISQEVLLIGSAFDESLSYTVGLFVSKETVYDMPFFQIIGNHGMMADTSSGLVVAVNKVIGTVSELDNETYAIFAQSTYDVTDSFQITLGIRDTIEKRERTIDYYEMDGEALATQMGKTFFGQLGSLTINSFMYDSLDDFHSLTTEYIENGELIPIIQRPTISDNERWEKITPTLTLSYNTPEQYLEDTALDSLLTYFTWSKGFKAGGFEPKGIGIVSFDPETLENFEVGFKFDFLESRLRLNGAVYYMDYSDIQLRVAEQGPVISDLRLFISNAGEAEIKGLELELTALLFGGMTMNLNASYTDAGFDEFMAARIDRTLAIQGLDPEIPVDRSNEDFAAVPKTTFSLSLSYDWYNNIGVIIPRLSGYYRDEMYLGMDYKSPDFEESFIDSVTTWDFRLTYIPVKLDQLNAILYVSNLTDKDYFQGGFAVTDALGVAPVTKAIPRSYGLELAYTF